MVNPNPNYFEIFTQYTFQEFCDLFPLFMMLTQTKQKYIKLFYPESGGWVGHVARPRYCLIFKTRPTLVQDTLGGSRCHHSAPVVTRLVGTRQLRPHSCIIAVCSEHQRVTSTCLITDMITVYCYKIVTYVSTKKSSWRCFVKLQEDMLTVDMTVTMTVNIGLCSVASVGLVPTATLQPHHNITCTLPPSTNSRLQETLLFDICLQSFASHGRFYYISWFIYTHTFHNFSRFRHHKYILWYLYGIIYFTCNYLITYYVITCPRNVSYIHEYFETFVLVFLGEFCSSLFDDYCRYSCHIKQISRQYSISLTIIPHCPFQRNSFKKQVSTWKHNITMKKNEPEPEQDELTEKELDVITTVFRSYETGLREATILPKVHSYTRSPKNVFGFSTILEYFLWDTLLQTDNGKWLKKRVPIRFPVILNRNLFVHPVHIVAVSQVIFLKL